MKVYISGMVTSLPIEEARENFSQAQETLEKYGFEVVNPLNNGLSPDDPWLAHMKVDIKLLMDCDAIYMLNNWEDSRGAKIEHDLAVSLGYNIIEHYK